MDQFSNFGQFFIAALGGDLKVVLAIFGFICIGIFATRARSEAVKSRSFEIILLSILCPTIIIIAVQKEARHDVYAGLIGTLIGYFFNAGKSGGDTGKISSDNKKNAERDAN